MTGIEPAKKPRWHWGSAGSQLFGSDGMEYLLLDVLSRDEVERLLSLAELDAVRVECGEGIAEWVDSNRAEEVWAKVKTDLSDVEEWLPPKGARGTQPYEAQLWRAEDGRHVLVFTSE